MERKLPLLEELIKYHKEGNLILSMPGNKCGKGFERDEIGKEFVKNMGYFDITEVDPLDNLQHPEGIIKEAQELVAKAYDVDNAYFMVNGSSGGNLISIFSAFNEGDEVLVERNCHKSVYNGLILKKLKVVYIEPVIDEKNDIFLPPNEEKIYEALDKCKNPKGIILTHPNYFGISYDIEKVLIELKLRGLKIILDGAHGAHYGFSEKLPKNIWKLVDYAVVSAHKTIPSLTQGGYLLVNGCIENLRFYMNALMTTSPSYLIMASLDYGRYYLEKYGEEDYRDLISLSEEYREKIERLEGIKVLKDSDLDIGYSIDKSRYLIVLDKGYSGHKLLDYLRKEKIQCEMSFTRGVVLILSPVNKREDFEHILKSFIKLDLEKIKEVSEAKFYSLTPNKELEPYEVFDKEYEIVSIKDSLGMIAKEAIVPYPPGIPLICPGEIISEEAINIIENYIENNREVLGIKDGYLSVVKIDEYLINE